MQYTSTPQIDYFDPDKLLNKHIASTKTFKGKTAECRIATKYYWKTINKKLWRVKETKQFNWRSMCAYGEAEDG